MKKYRYILTGRTGPDESVNGFRLIAPQIVTKQWDGCCSVESEAIRVDVTGLNINHYPCDMYSTLEDDIALRDLDPKIFIRKNDKWQVNEELTEKWLKGEIPYNDLHDYITEKMGLRSSLKGYYTEDAYREFRDREENVRKEAEAFIKDYAKKYLDKKTLKQFNKRYMFLDFSSDLSEFKRKEWEERARINLDRFKYMLEGKLK
jgi:hypothetical protein